MRTYILLIDWRSHPFSGVVQKVGWSIRGGAVTDAEPRPGFNRSMNFVGR